MNPVYLLFYFPSLSLPLSLHQHSTKSSACSIYVTTTLLSPTPQNATHTPINLYIVSRCLRAGAEFDKFRLSLARGRRFIEAHYSSSWISLPSVALCFRPDAVWCDEAGEDSMRAVWGHTSHWKSARQCGRRRARRFLTFPPMTHLHTAHSL